MTQLNKCKVVEQDFQVLFELSDKAGNIQERIHSIAKREVVGLCQDLNTVRERALPANSFLEGCTRSSAAIYLSVEKTLHDEFLREHLNMRLHDIGSVGPGKTPDNVACCIADVASDRMISQVDVISKRLFKHRDKCCNPFWQQKPAPGQFCERQAATVPRLFGLGCLKQILELLDDLIGEVLRKAHRNTTNALCSGPSDHVLVIFERVEQVLNNEFQLFKLLFGQVFIVAFLVFHFDVRLRLDLLRLCRRVCNDFNFDT